MSSPVLLQTTEELTTLWNTLGLSPSEQNKQFCDLKNKMYEIYSQCIQSLTDQCQKTRKQIEEINNKHRQAMSAYGLRIDEIEKAIPPIEDTNLIEQLNNAQMNYDNFRKIITERVSKIENMVHICKDLFTKLEVPEEECGEFVCVGDNDFTRERLDRFRKKIETLQKEEASRRSNIEQIKKRIYLLMRDIGDASSDAQVKFLQSDSVAPSYITNLTNLEESLKEERRVRLQDLSDMAVKITHMWDTLEVPQRDRESFTSRYCNISAETLECCKREIERLQMETNKRLPKLIENQRIQVQHLWDTLHIAVESRPVFNDVGLPEEAKLSAEYQFYEEESLRLKQFEVDYHDVLELIAQREGIISEYEEVCSESKDPNRLTSRDRGMAQQLIKEEKARRRYKTVLPKLEKKLAAALIEHAKKDGTQFEWDGQPYIDFLPQDVVAGATKEPVKKAHTMRAKGANARNDENANATQSLVYRYTTYQ